MASAFSDLYATLRRLAERALAAERSNHTLETGGLIAEAYLRLIERQRTQWNSREHFLATAAQMMRHILVDYARGRATAKRGPGTHALPLADAALVSPDALVGVAELDDALESLQRVSRSHSEVVELRFFGGLTHVEIAKHLGISVPTVERRWRLARAWMYRHLTSAQP
jgi:RNA polymerase sigma factor (TIGR02999 family)